ncbi:16237_t:CDS:1, partial [Cetraspora pellucida]
LTKIELLLKSLYNDKNIIKNVALKTVYNSARDQNSKFIQAIFWAYYAFTF